MALSEDARNRLFIALTDATVGAEVADAIDDGSDSSDVATAVVAAGLAAHLADTSDAHDASAVSVLDTATIYTATNVETALAEVKVLADAAFAKTAGRKVSLSAAAESGNAIVVTGQVTDLAGTNVASACEVLVTTLAVTDNKGDISVTAGTSIKVVNPATGPNVAWITTTGTGGFAVSVANDVAESTLIEVRTNLGVAANLLLNFALV